MYRVHGWQGLAPSLRGASVALGNFDGVHLGHAKLLHAAHAARPDAPLAVLSFEPHPRELFRPDDAAFRLTLPDMRAELLAGLGVGILYELKFDQVLADFTAQEFLDTIIGRGIGARQVCCGTDFAFGHRRGGDVDLLGRWCEQAGVGLTVVPPLVDRQGPISSSRIRRLLQDGYPGPAARELGRLFKLRGEVKHGDALGRTLGFPTANIGLGRQIEPARGVYAVRVDGQGAGLAGAGGVANIGRRPTVGGQESRLELHILDWTGDLYGQILDVSLVEFLRPEQKFPGLDALRAQIGRDAAAARVRLG
ncbi:MAG: bifunctional riboflavin kinase/FAD synthetase [Acidocella sp.]|nr:bifunctional riboflavin kinase/FAD synthetase [Acidocella sp.]